MYKYTSCSVCKNQNFQSFISCKDYTVSQETFSIVICSACGFKFTNPIPDLNSLGNYYKSENYISHSNTRKGIIARLYHIVRSYTLKKKLKLVSSYVSRGTILDYGCGTGMFLKVCKEAGWNPIGMEPDSGARQIAASMNISAEGNKEDIKKKFPDQTYKAITLWHVLEHVTDLNETLSFFKAQLESDGVLIIAVPNHLSYDALHYEKYWAAYDVPRHLYHFEKKTIAHLLSNFGFQLQNTFPMAFDSFYVSMLSEKYKTGKVNYIKAFLTGLKSNLKAKPNCNYSSVIYVFKHKN